MFDSPTITQHLVACLVISYFAFSVFYGYTSLKARRAAAAGRDLPATRMGFAAILRNIGQVARLAVIVAIPVLMLATMLTFAGRERSGIVESSGLFTVQARPDVTTAFLASGDAVHKGEVVARFASDVVSHRVASLRAKRQEVVAHRDALKVSTLPQSAEDIVRLQAVEQRLAQIEQRLTEIMRSGFATRQQLIASRTDWERTRGDLVARIPQFELALAASEVEHKTARGAHDRIRNLRERGYATVGQLETVTIAKTTARQRVDGTRDALASTRRAIETLDSGFAQSRQLLETELDRLAADARAATAERAVVVAELDAMRPRLDGNRNAASARRRHELAAAEARIHELDNEIAAVVANTHVRSPISGRVLYRNLASSTLHGSMPLLVVASSEGFLMRVDLARDEITALTREAASGETFEVVVDDRSVRRLVPARFVRIDDKGLDGKRVTAVFGLDMPEDMLVRMALRGTSPRGTLKWTPSPIRLVTSRIEQALGIVSRNVQVAVGTQNRPKPQPARSDEAARLDPTISL